MANSNPYLILRRCRDSVIKSLRELFSPENNTAVPNFEYSYLESYASGTVQFFGNPTNGDTFTIGVNTITFVTGSPTGLQVQIGITQQITLANFVALINANSSTLLVGATTNSIPKQLTLTATVRGVAGNSITLAFSSLVLRVSAPHLTQGGLFDFTNSKIFIADAIPQDYQDWPMIVVDTASARETRYLGPEDLAYTKNYFNVVNTDEIFSSLEVVINIKVYTIDDTLARDNIIDLIYNNLSTIRHQLAINGLEMIDRTMPTETRVFQDQRQYITNHFVLRVYCEWTDSLTPITNVSGISLTIPVHTQATPVINSPISSTGPYQSPLSIISIASGTSLEVSTSDNVSIGDKIVQGNITSIVTAVPNSTHVIVNSTVGFTAGAASCIVLPFTYQITATGNPTSYASSTLPAGLSINTVNGLISGTPTVEGTFYITLQATNSTGTGTSPLTLTISLPS